jgi:hypothetical protein
LRRLLLIAAAVALLAAIVAVIFWLFPGDERQIRRLFDEVATVATLKGIEHPLVKIAGGNKLGGYVTADVEMVLDAPGLGERTLSGREEMIQNVTAVRATVQQVLIRFENIQLEIDSAGGTASARLVAVAEVDSMSGPVVQEMKVGLTRTDEGWRIRRVETVRASTIPPAAQ